MNPPRSDGERASVAVVPPRTAPPPVYMMLPHPRRPFAVPPPIGS